MSVKEKLDSIKLHLGSAYSKIQAKGGTVPTNKNISNLTSAIDSIQGGGAPSDVRLNAPVLSWGVITTTTDQLVITNSYNGNFVDSYDIYSGTTFLTSISASLEDNKINLRDYISQGGTYTIRVIAKGDGMLDSYAATISYTYRTYVAVTNNLSNCTTNNSATTIIVGNSYNAILTAEEGYSFVNASISILVNNQDVTADAYKGKGVIEIENVTGPISITATFAVITQLAKPTISISDGILTITPVTNAEKYVLCLNGNDWQEFDVTTIDLTEYLTVQGSYNVSIKDRADGYLDNESSTIIYTNSDGEIPSIVLNDNSWSTIRLICESVQATDYWSVGNTKTDVGTDGKTRTFRIVDMQGLYNKHVVFEQVELEIEPVRLMGSIPPNKQCYPRSYMRTTALPNCITRYSESLQKSLNKTRFGTILREETAAGGFVNTYTEIEDKLFLPASKELGGSGNYIESGYLSVYQYYYTNNNASDRIKHPIDNVNAETYWTRSPAPFGNYYSWSVVNVSGNISDNASSIENSYYYAPCFAF